MQVYRFFEPGEAICSASEWICW